MNSYYEKILATGEVKCIDEEIPFDVPQGWEWERWGNIAQTIQYGYNAPALERGVIKMVRISDIQENCVLWNNVPYCLIDENDIDTYLLKVNDILFARTGGTVGKSFLVEEVPEKAIYAGYLIRTRYSSLLNPRYMKSFMESQLYWEQLKNGTIATAQPNCNGKTLAKMLLPIPPTKEQERIVGKLIQLSSFLDNYSLCQDRLNLLNREIKNLLKKSILQEAIQGKLVPQIEEEGTALELFEQIKAEKQKLFKEGKLKKSALNDSVIFRGDDNKYYENFGEDTVCIDEEIPFPIPNNWAWSRLSSMCSIVNGFTPLRSESKFWDCGTINWFTVEDIKNQGEIIYYTKQKITDEAVSKERMVRAGSVLLCCTASVGQCALAKIDLTTNQQFNALTVKDFNKSILTDNYLFWFAKTLKPTLLRLSGKTTFEFVSVKKVENILIPIPPFKEQQRIVAQIAKLFEQLH